MNTCSRGGLITRWCHAWGAMTVRSLVRTGAVLLAVGALLGACGDDDSSSGSFTSEATTTTLSANEQLCADRDALKGAIADLKNVNIIANGTSGVQAALTKVTDSVGDLKQSASASVAPQVDALE